MTAEIANTRRNGVADNEHDAAKRWYLATGHKLPKAEAVAFVVRSYGLSELEALRLTRATPA